MATNCTILAKHPTMDVVSDHQQTVNDNKEQQLIETITSSTTSLLLKRCDSPRPQIIQAPNQPVVAIPSKQVSPSSVIKNNLIANLNNKHSKNNRNNNNRNNRNRIKYSYNYWNPRPKNKCIGIGQEVNKKHNKHKKNKKTSSVYLICDNEYVSQCDKLEKDKNKYGIFWELIKAYKLNEKTRYGHKLKIIPSSIASRDDLLSYHDENYINLLETVENYPQYSYQTEEEKELLREYGLIDDNPIFDGLYEYCLNITGASLKCAELIKSGKTRIAINYGGGRHHSFSSKANGFCYVNDIILCIDSLRDTFDKILYIDIDLHHCDSIQEAYYNSNNVFVVSIHHKDIDFFPQNTGDKNKLGEKQGTFYNLNIPIHKNLKLTDDAFINILSKIIHRLNYYFQPECIVVCAGCDGLQSDPFKKWNLSINGITRAINMIITEMDKPTIILGGGGYNPYDTAKCWTSILANVCNINIDNDIPYHENYSKFKPHYQLNKMKMKLEDDDDVGVGINHNHFLVQSPQHQHQINMLDRKKQQKLNIHAMQMIYGHLNNFERLFVEKVLKSNRNKHKNGYHQHSHHQIRQQQSNGTNTVKNNNMEIKDEDEEENEDEDDDIDIADKHINDKSDNTDCDQENNNDSNNKVENDRNEDNDKEQNNENDEPKTEKSASLSSMNSNITAKKRQMTTTVTTKSRRKRRKLQ